VGAAWRATGMVAVICLIVAGRAAAQTPPARPAPATQTVAGPPLEKVEFDEAIQRAIEKNLSIALSANQISQTEMRLVTARAKLYPDVTATYQNNTLNTQSGFNGLVTQPQNQSLFFVGASVPVLNLVSVEGLRVARDQIEVSRRSAADVRKDVAVSTALAYLGIINARRQVDVETRAMANAQAHLDYADLRLQGGAGSRLNQVRAAQEVAAEQARLEAATLIMRRAQEALGVLLAADTPIDAGADPMFETPSPADEAEWMQTRTDVRLETANRAAADRILQNTWRAYVGTATAGFTPEYIAPSSIFQQSNSWRFGITFTQPLFDHTLVGFRRSQQLLVDQASLSLSAVELEARSEVRIARYAVESLQRALDSARQAATDAADVLRITTAAFQVGANTNIEVIDAERSARDADTTASLAEDALRRAQLDLLVAMGRFPR
jgi:outer membrane protein TolC